MKNKNGFTLIELLVVISIIALLMSMLLPALTRVKNQAKGVVCQNNLHQWGVAGIAYSNDNDNQIVAEYDQGEWLYKLKPFMGMSEKTNMTTEGGDVAFCPSANKPRTASDGGRGMGYGLGPESAWGYTPGDGYMGGTAGSYGFNCWVYNVTIRDQDGSHVLAPSWRTFNVKGGNDIPLIGGCYGKASFVEANDDLPEYEVEAELGRSGMATHTLDRHNGNVNMTFLDGSARSVGLKELWTLSWHREFQEDYKTRTARGSIDWPEWMKNFKDYN